MNKRKAKIGTNRGKARLWLEGQWLVDAGFNVGYKFTAEITAGRLTLRADPAGNRTVSGKGIKPIIDINTDQLQQVSAAGSHIDLRVSFGTITGTPE